MSEKWRGRGFRKMSGYISISNLQLIKLAEDERLLVVNGTSDAKFTWLLREPSIKLKR